MTTAEHAPDVQPAIGRYFDAWNEPDPATRQATVDATWSAKGHYVDPLVDVNGRDAISSMIGSVHEQYPGLAVRLASTLDMHHELIRFHWELSDASGSVVVSGVDIARVDTDGALVEVLGFFGDRVDR